MKLPRITAQTPPPVQRAVIPSGAARAEDIGALTRTGDQAMWRSVQQAGEALQGAGQTLFAIDQDKRAMDRELKISQFMQGLESRDATQKETIVEKANITSEEEQRSSLNAMATSRKSWITERINAEKDPKLRTMMKVSAIRSEPEFRTDIKSLTTARWTGYKIAEWLKERDIYNNNGEFERADQVIDMMVANNLIQPKDGLKLKRENVYQRVSYFINNKNFDEARKVVKGENKFIDQEDKRRLNDTIRIAEQSTKEALTEYRQQTENDMRGRMLKADADNLLLLEKHNLVIEMKNESVAKGISTDQFFNTMDDWEKGMLKESNPEVKAKVLERIRNNKITESEISELVGKGLSVDDTDRFINNMDFFKDSWFKRADMFFKSQLGWDGAYEKFMHPQGGLAYKLASDELFKAIDAEELKGKDIYDRATQISIPYIVDYWENVLTLGKPEIERLTKMLKGEGEKETEEPNKPKKPEPVTKKAVIDPEGIF